MKNKTGFLAVLAALCIVLTSAGCSSKATGAEVYCFDEFKYTVPYSNEEMKKKGYPDAETNNSNYIAGYGWFSYNSNNDVEKYFLTSCQQEEYLQLAEIMYTFSDCERSTVKIAGLDGVLVYDISNDSNYHSSMAFVPDPVTYATYIFNIESNDDSLYNRNVVKQFTDSIKMADPDARPMEFSCFDAFRLTFPYSTAELENKELYYWGSDHRYEAQIDYSWVNENKGLYMSFVSYSADQYDLQYFENNMKDYNLEYKKINVAGMDGFVSYGEDAQNDVVFGQIIVGAGQNTYLIEFTSFSDSSLVSLSLMESVAKTIRK